MKSLLSKTRSFVVVLMTLMSAMRSSAESVKPVRIGIISENSESGLAVDLLTAALASSSKIQLVERDQIQKIYHEQSLAAANKDYLKLGQLLGADGLFLLQVLKTSQSTNLVGRLIVVKPGVVLTDARFPWPLANPGEWANYTASGLETLVPKLTVSSQEAIPLSVVNFRCATPTTNAPEIEHDLKLLMIQRLSRERQFFVLERQRMQLLTQEKDLQLDDSAFWNGSYLVEGVVDQNGYSADRMTIDVRLTPPKGGQVLNTEASGSRTNLAEVVNQLATKITELLHVAPSAPALKAEDEATAYLEEAKWALRWGVLPEAQAAADSAWALGKHDQDCAAARVRAYLVPQETGRYQKGDATNFRNVQEELQFLQDYVKPRPICFAYKADDTGGVYALHCVWTAEQPQVSDIASAVEALDDYEAFTKTLAPADFKTDSSWYQLGLDAMTSSSQVLQYFHFVPESQKDNAEELAQLRSKVRRVAELLEYAPGVREGYYITNLPTPYDKLDPLLERPNIFVFEVRWGCLWQDRPEDCVALYQRLMSTPVFRYVHHDFWLRELQLPRLTAWSDTDRKRLDSVWTNFMRELDNSTNVLLRLEGKALRFADATNDIELGPAFTNFFDEVLQRQKEIVTVPVDILYLHWGVDDLVWKKCSAASTGTKQNLNRRYISQIAPQLDQMRNDYGLELGLVKQKAYLTENKRYDFLEFVSLFNGSFSQKQASELLPLVTTYKKSLIQQSESLDSQESSNARIGLATVQKLENQLLHALSPASTNSVLKVQTNQNANRPLALKPATPAEEPAGEIASNIILVKNWVPLPLELLKENLTNETIYDPHLSLNTVQGGKIWYHLNYKQIEYVWQTDGSMYKFNRAQNAEAILDLKTHQWQVIHFPDPQSPSWQAQPENSQILEQNIYVSRGGILRRYDLKTGQWESMTAPWPGAPRLSAVGGRLFGVSGDSIFEIHDGGHHIELLASTRRRPAINALDMLNNLGSAQLFEAHDKGLCVALDAHVFRQEGQDWKEFISVMGAQSSEILDNALLFRTSTAWDERGPVKLWFWNMSSPAPALAVYEKSSDPSAFPRIARPVSARPVSKAEKPIWKALPFDSLLRVAATHSQDDLYFLVEHAVLTNKESHLTLEEKSRLSSTEQAWREWTLGEKNGYHARLVCLSHDLPDPIIVPLKYDLERGFPPSAMLSGKLVLDRPHWLLSPARLLFFDDAICITQEETMGVWLLPKAEIESAIQKEKERMLAANKK